MGPDIRVPQRRCPFRVLKRFTVFPHGHIYDGTMVIGIRPVTCAWSVLVKILQKGYYAIARYSGGRMLWRNGAKSIRYRRLGNIPSASAPKYQALRRESSRNSQRSKVLRSSSSTSSSFSFVDAISWGLLLKKSGSAISA